MFCDEIDAYIAGKEGDPCALADRAAITFTDAWKIKCSTTTLTNFSRVYDGFKRGDQQLFFIPCPCCGGFQDLKTEQLKFSFTPEEHARFDCNPNDYTWQTFADAKKQEGLIRETKRAMYVCEHCHRGWTDTQRIQSYMSGDARNPPVIVKGKELRADWRATAPFNGIRSKALNGMYITIGLKKDYVSYLQQFAEQFMAACEGGRETLMVWCNIFANKPFEDEAEITDWQVLKKRAEDYTVPVQVCWIAFGADVHPDRFELVFVGWGDRQEQWVLDRKVIMGDFDMPEMQDRVWDYLSNKKFAHPILGDMEWKAGAIDSGHQTKVQAVFKFAAQHAMRSVWSCKGFDEALGAVYERKKERVHAGIRFNFNVDYLKNQIFDRLRNTEPGANYIHFHARLDNDFFQQLCSERKVTVKQANGGFKTQWVKPTSSTRNEVLDCMVYCQGVYEVCREGEVIARTWKKIQEKLREQNIPDPVAKREVYMVPAEKKIPELQPPPVVRRPARRRIRIANPFGHW